MTAARDPGGVSCRPDAVSVRFRGVPAPVLLDGTGDLLSAIDDVFPGWPRKVLSRRSPTPPVITVRRDGDGYRRQSKWVKEADLDDDPADAMCNFVSDIIDAYIEEHAGMLGIHASAVRIGGRLVVMPSAHRAGKSLLVTHLVSRGAVLFSDDVLLIPPRGLKGMATGIAPRLRLPVPEERGGALSEFLENTGMCANRRYGWVRLRPGPMAPLGERAPVGAVVLLDRREEFRRKPGLTPIARTEALTRTVDRGFSLEASAGEVLSRLSRMVGAAECFRLTYGSAAEAADRLMDSFASGAANRERERT